MGLFQDRIDARGGGKKPKCVRKEYRRLRPHEVRAYHGALNAMKDSDEYGMFVRYHRVTMSPAAHEGPAFFVWHLVFLLLYVNPARLTNQGPHFQNFLGKS